jgi:hypothetical protein
MTIARRAARLAAICTFLAALAVASVCATGKAWAQPHGGISALRWDTSGNTSGTGPRWHTDMGQQRRFRGAAPAGLLASWCLV